MKYLFCDRCGKRREVDGEGFPKEHFTEGERLVILGIYKNDGTVFDNTIDIANWFHRERDLCSSCLNELREMQKKHDLEVINWFNRKEGEV